MTLFKNLLILLFLISLVSCGSDKSETRQFNTTDLDFYEHIDIFNDYLLRHRNHMIDYDLIPINHKKMEGLSGACVTYGDGTREIFIDDSKTPNREPYRTLYIETVVMHELGHCYLDKVHTDNPEDVMKGSGLHFYYLLNVVGLDNAYNNMFTK